jgi:hypothetical protein
LSSLFRPDPPYRHLLNSWDLSGPLYKSLPSLWESKRYRHSYLMGEETIEGKRKVSWSHNEMY